MTEVDSQTETVLLFDTDLGQTKVWTTYLESLKVEICKAHRPEELLDILTVQKPALIAGDLLMINENGKILFETLKDLENAKDSFFLLIHSGPSVAPDDPLLSDERVDMVASPVRKDLFLSKIRRQFVLKRMRDDLRIHRAKNDTALAYIRKAKKQLQHTQQLLDREKDLTNTSLRQIAIMVEERELLKKRVTELDSYYKDNFDRFIDLLSFIVESKRQYHRGHARRVADSSIYIARSYGLSEESVRHIEVSALLHEIGQLSVPDDVLLKTPSDYSDRERNLMALHPVKGAKLLENFTGFKEIAKIIESIHERVDGQGVPKGLKKEAIPLGARIIALSSYYDELLHLRDQDASTNAFEMIEENIGVLFDASVVNRLRRYVHETPASVEEKSIALGIFNLKPGMVLAAPLYTKKGAKLIQTGVSLTEASINQIAKYSKIDPLEETIFIKG